MADEWRGYSPFCRPNGRVENGSSPRAISSNCFFVRFLGRKVLVRLGSIAVNRTFMRPSQKVGERAMTKVAAATPAMIASSRSVSLT
jgi:hypothetical protein